MMQISHEVPLSVLSKSEEFNDYDYCLLHLTYKNKDYKKYYQEAVKKGRKVLLDNSIFELGDALTLKKVARGVRDIKPTWVVVPDCLDNKDITIQRFKEWEKYYSNLDVLTIGVVQGKTIDELMECYSFMSEHADKIAIPFDSVAFHEYESTSSEYSTKLEEWCSGRQKFIQQLVAEEKWNYYKPHHLLGCSLAREFSNPLYTELNIETVDTSNPVVAAIHQLRYNIDGLNIKPPTKLCDLINHKLSEYEERLMVYNIQMFRYICNREKKWVAFFSQTGSEISNLIEKTGKHPFAVITTNRNFIPSPANKALIREKFEFETIFILNKDIKEDNYIQLFKTLGLNERDLITLHGYLKIIPASICNYYSIYNLHPGLITKYPVLKGKDPQQKAFDLKLDESGVVIHEVIPEVDSGPVVLERKTSIKNLTLEEIYEKLHVLASDTWMDFLNTQADFSKKRIYNSL